jgi:hypothetical protein
MHGSRSKISGKKSRPYIYNVKFLALLGAPYTRIYDISTLRVNYMTSETVSSPVYCPWHSRSDAALSPRTTEFVTTQSAWSTSNAGKVSAPVPRFAPANTFPLPLHSHNSYTISATDTVKQPIWRHWQPQIRSTRPTATWHSLTAPVTVLQRVGLEKLCFDSPQASRLSLI